jgi:hypothetical protein
MVFVRPVVVDEGQHEARRSLMGESEMVDVSGKFR